MNKIILLTGCAMFVTGQYFARKQKVYDQIFKDIEKCPKYHFDYVADLQHLPLNKKMLIFGNAATQNPEDQFIIKTYIKKSSQKDRFWNFKFTNNFFLVNKDIQKILVKPDDSVDNFAFNLEKNAQKGNLQERVIKNNAPTYCYGVLQRVDDMRVLKTQIVMGSQHQSMLIHFDKQVLKYSQLRKFFVLGGTLILAGHFIYNFAFRETEKTEIQKQIQKIQVQSGKT